MLKQDYIRDGAAIYARSFAIIREEADLARFSDAQADVAVRMIHACGRVDAAASIDFSPDLVHAARNALQEGAPIFCDAQMVAHGVTRARLPADNDVICTLRDDRVVPSFAARSGTRSSRSVQITSLSAGSRARVTPWATICASQKIGAPCRKAPRAACTKSGEKSIEAAASTRPQAWIMRTATSACASEKRARSASSRMMAKERA